MAPSVLLLAFSPLLFGALAAAQETSTVSGRVLERDNNKPVPDVVVRIQGTELRSITRADGTFRIEAVPRVSQILVVEHLAYGELVEGIVVGDSELKLEVRIARQAIKLSPLVVAGVSERERSRRGSGNARKEIQRDRIDVAALRGKDLGRLLRDELLGIRVSQGTNGNYCVEYRLTTGRRNICREVAMFLDGVRVSAPSSLYSTLPLQDLERIQLLSPSEAGARYGSDAGWGVLLIETRQAPRRER
jgi:hypothetical protein